MGSPPTSNLQPGPHTKRFPLVWPSKTTYFGGTLSWRWGGWKSGVCVVPTANKRILRRRFPGTCEMVGQVFKFVWRLRWKVNVCMSLSSLVSFQSRFVTYLSTYARISVYFKYSTPNKRRNPLPRKPQMPIILDERSHSVFHKSLSGFLNQYSMFHKLPFIETALNEPSQRARDCISKYVCEWKIE